MPHKPWSEQGCTLAEALDRTSDRHRDRPERDIDTKFRWHFENQQFVAYGRPGDLSAEPHWIPSDVWRSVFAIDLTASAICGGERGVPDFHDVRVFPTLLAPCRAELLAGRPLSEIFRRFILEDPEVAYLSQDALKANALFHRVFNLGSCYASGVDEWPTAYEGRNITGAMGLSESPLGFSADPDPPSVIIAAEALIARYGALLNVLRRRELEAKGIPAAGFSELVLCSIWSHPKFHFNATSGDIFEINSQAKDLPWDRLLKRWSAVVLQYPSTKVTGERSTRADQQESPFHVKPAEHDGLRSHTPADRELQLQQRSPNTSVSQAVVSRTKRPRSDAVEAALEQMGIDIAVSPLSLKGIAAQISPALKQSPKTEAESAALAKCLGRLRAKKRKA